MTSNSAVTKISELSPEKRQLLFEKIRQKKLVDARRPEGSGRNTNNEHFKASPHQAHLLKTIASSKLTNRLLQINLQANLTQESLNQASNGLVSVQTALSASLSGDSTGFSKSEPNVLVSTSELSDHQAQDPEWQKLIEKMAALENSNQCIHIHLVQTGPGQQTLLIAAHPLLLDTYSLLRFANQLLSLLNGSVEANNLSTDENCHQNSYATWSEQVLDKKFLRNEWNRLAPKLSQQNESLVRVEKAASHNLWLSTEFIQQFASPSTSIKQWLFEALDKCLNDFQSFNEISYWLADPLLKDIEFENLLGFFPYYMPIEQKANTHGQFNIGQQFSKLHTRYSAVSEHLANHLCQHGTNAPLLHYHWFDVEASQQSHIKIDSIHNYGAGIGLSNMEIHVTELANGVSIDVHYSPQSFDRKQIEYFRSQLFSLLKQRTPIDPSKRPSLAQQLETIWQELLQLEEINPQLSFFELGGHSLQVTEMKFRIKQLLKVDIPISVLYELPTIEKLSSYILATHGNQLNMALVDIELTDDQEEEGTL